MAHIVRLDAKGGPDEFVNVEAFMRFTYKPAVGDEPSSMECGTDSGRTVVLRGARADALLERLNALHIKSTAES